MERPSTGMFVSLPGSSLGHPFLRSKSQIRPKAQLRRLQACGIQWVRANPSRSKMPGRRPAPEPREAAQQIVRALADPQAEPRETALKVYRLTKRVVTAVFENPNPSNILLASGVAKALAEAIAANEEIGGTVVRLAHFDELTYGHSVRVACLAICLASKVLGPEQAALIQASAPGFLLHDIGKTALPKEVLERRGPLSDEDWREIKRHPEEGHRILSSFKEISAVSALIALQHHERSDGTGYPNGLTAEQIHPLARICSIADVFDALTGPRPCRNALSALEALQLMRDEMLHHFQPDFFEKFVLLSRPGGAA
ncbi:MAG: HD-GYP domain-containing protein [Fimbriimonadales bacterium]|nr:HD-GYP domain-containing protein [Fimbriimonadales bacterium]